MNECTLVFFIDPGKYNFTPRLFHLNVQSGMFKGEELLCASRAPGVVTAMPFFQDCLYSVPQPGERAMCKIRNCTHMFERERGRHKLQGRRELDCERERQAGREREREGDRDCKRNGYRH